MSKQNVEEIDAAKNEGSVMNQSTSKSPHKSLAIKGPPKVINEKLDIDNYQGVKSNGHQRSAAQPKCSSNKSVKRNEHHKFIIKAWNYICS
jgi:hypothetical protein